MQSLVQHYKTRADRKDDNLRLRSPPSADAEPHDDQQLRDDAETAFHTLSHAFPDPPDVLPVALPKPVVIPQRRQGDRLRGFQLLYAAELAQSGVSEPDFVRFLNRLNVAIGFDSRVTIFNFAIDMATLACSSWELLLATIATQALTTTAAHLKSRAKSEAYVAHANERFFHPRGLHAQIVPIASLASTDTPLSPSSEEREASAEAESSSSFQFSLGSPNVLPLEHPKAKGGLFNLNKRPIEYDPFDYGPGYVRILPHQYCALQPSRYREPANSLLDKVAHKVEKYNVWQDRLPAKKYASRQSKRQDKLARIYQQEGEAGVLRFLQTEEQKHQQRLDKQKTAVARLMDRNKVILIITNLDDSTRAQMQSRLGGTT